MYTLNPWEVVRPEQNFTFFVPTDEAWYKVPAYLREEFLTGRRSQALQYVKKDICEYLNVLSSGSPPAHYPRPSTHVH